MDAIKDVRDSYRAFLKDKTSEYCSTIKTKYPCLADCRVSYTIQAYSAPTIDIDTSTSCAVKQYNEDCNAYNDFMNKAESKVIALLSVQKEVSDLDSFIVSVVSTIK